jgi:hypothetical protein
LGTTDIHQIQHNEQQELLAELRDALIPGGFSFHDHIMDYREQLNTRFRLQYSVTDLAAREEYQNWREAGTSRVLILQGRTRHPTSPLSWLSPAAVELGEVLGREQGQAQGQDAPVIVSYFCRRETTMPLGHIHTVLANIAFQILAARPALLLHDRETFHNCRTLAKGSQWQLKDPKTACEVLGDLLIRLDKVYLILDRPEICKRAEAGLRSLIQASRRTSCVLKTLLVVDKDCLSRFDVDELREVAGVGGLDVIDVPDQ